MAHPRPLRSVRCARRLQPLALAALAACTGLPAWALPSGAQVVSGQLGVATPAPGQMLLTQGSARTIVDWQRFGIASGETVRLQQPGGGLALFRVVGGEGSQIFGSLSANAHLFLVNPHGVLFGAGSRVDVGSLTASTLDLSNNDFLAGRYRFSGDSQARVENQGEIRAAEGGHLVLLARQVVNGGTLAAPRGTVALGAAGAATLDVYGDGLLRLVLDTPAEGARVDHSGLILAEGGAARLQALGPAAVLNVGGLVQARGLQARDGEIVLSAGPQGTVAIDGAVDAGGGVDGLGGGSIDIRARDITLGAGAQARADANGLGRGGSVVLVADRHMQFDGHVSARGGERGGDGGFAEVSGHDTLTINGTADLRAPAGRFGDLLLDPGAINVTTNGNASGPNNWRDTRLATLLNSANTTLSTATSNSANSAETITVEAGANVTWSAATTLTLSAGRNIVVAAGARLNSTSATTGFDAIVMKANQGATASTGNFAGIAISGATVSSAGGRITLNGTGGNDALGGNHGIALNNASLSTQTGTLTLNGTGGPSTGASNVGVRLTGTNTVQATGTGGVVIRGTAGQGSGAHGVFNNGTLTVSGRSVQVIGTGGGSDAGLQMETGSATFTGTSGGNVSLVADRMAIAATSGGTSGTLSLAPLTAGRAIDVGGADSASALGLSTADLDGFNPSGRLEIGSTAAGRLTVSSAFAPTAGTGTLALVSGDVVDVSATLTGGATRLNLSGTAGVRLRAALSSTASAVAATRAITIRTPGTFDNVVGASALSAPNGNWTVSLTTPLGQNFNGLLSNNTAIWNNPVTSNVGLTGNRYSFAIAPTIFISGGTLSKTYGDTLNTAVTLSGAPITSIAQSFGGVFTDYNTGTLSGTYSRSSSGLAATANVGTYTDLQASGLSGLTTSLNGYSIAAGTAGSVTVTQRPLTIMPGAVTRVYGDANPTTAAAFGNNLVNGDTLGSVSITTAATTASGVGTYATTGGTASFTSGLATNYAITYADNAAGLQVTQRSLTVTPGAVSRVYGDANPATASATGNNLVNGDTLGTVAISSAATTASSVGTYSTSGSGATFTSGAASNYAITYADNASGLQVTQRALTVTPGAVSRVYGDANPATAGATGNNLVNGDTLGTVAITSAATTASSVGTYSTSGSGATFTSGAASNYAITYTDNAAGLQVTQRSLTVTPGAVSRVYGDANPATAGATGNNLVNGDTLGTVAITSVATATSNVGSYSTSGSGATFTSGATSNYAITYADNTSGLQVTQRALTITPDAVSRVYGDANPATASATGNNLVNGDTLGTVAITSAATTASSVGTYSTSGSGATFTSGAASNYAITYADNTSGLQVTQRALTITPDAVSRVYGDANPATASATGNNLVNGDTLGTVAITSAATTASSVGTYSTSGSGATFTSGAASNYAITYADNTSGLQVTQRSLTVTPGAVSRVYGDANPATASATGNNLVNGDTLGTVAITGAATTASSVGTYSTSGSGATFTSGAASNYAITYADNTSGLQVTQRALTITPDAVSRVYGDANPATAGATGNNLVNGDTLGTVAITSAATTASSVGTYSTSGSGATFTSGAASNYAITYADNTSGLQVTQRSLTVTPGAVSRVYGDANPATASATGNNLVNGDTLGTVAITSAATTASSVGTYSTSGSGATFTSGAASNYAITYADNTSGLQVTQRALTITPDAVSRVYGDANPATASATGNNLVNGDTLGTVAISSAATTASNVGSYSTSGSAAIFTSGAASNYAISYADNAAGLQVTQRSLMITPDAVSRVYGDANPATASATGNNLVNGDTLGTVAITSAATAASSVGTYSTSGSGATFTSGAASNYAISYADNTSGLQVTQRSLTVTPGAVSRVYGDANPATAGATGNNLVNGDTLGTVAITSAATTASSVGTYSTSGSGATFTSGSASNYAITYADNTSGLQVTQRSLTVTPGAVSRVYGDANTATASATGNNLVNGDTLGTVAITSAATTASSVGTYSTSGSGATFTSGNAGNYAISYVANDRGLQIDPRLLRVTPDAVSRAYGDANPTTTTARADNLVNGDSLLQVSLQTPATVSSGVGTYAVTPSQAVFAAGQAANYSIEYLTDGRGLAVTPRALTLTPEAASRLYGDANPARGTASASGAGLVNGDRIDSVALTSPAALASGAGRYDLGAADALFAQGQASNYAITYAAAPQALSVQPRPLTVAAAPGQSKTAGTADPELGYGISAGRLVNGDTLAGRLQRDPGELAGSYAIGLGSLTAGPNYALTFEGGASFTIVATPTTVVTVASPVIDRQPVIGTPGDATAQLNALLANLPPTAAGPTSGMQRCVREQLLDRDGQSRVVNRGMRLPEGVEEPCR